MAQAKRTKLFFVVSLITLIGLFVPGGASQAAADDPVELVATRQTIFIAGDEGTGIHIPPPENFSNLAPATANIVVNFIGSWNAQAQNAFNYAVNIWETQIDSNITIKIDAEWDNLGPNILGGAGPLTYYRDGGGLPQSGTWYPVALANTLTNSDLNGGNAEIGATFNSGFSDWYFGTDGNTPFNKWDFVSVVLHEIGHGLGFSDSFAYSGGVGSYGLGTPYPVIYDRFVENGSGQVLINAYGNFTTALGGQLTSNNVFFGGDIATVANSSGRPKLYAPNPWQGGSSIAHLDESTFNGTPNALMTPAINNGESIHSPGNVTLGIFEDMSWSTALVTNNAPNIVGFPSHMLLVNTSKNHATDLWAFVSDESSDNLLDFSIVNSPNPSAGVTLDVNDNVDVYPATDWTGITTVIVEVEDPEGLTSSGSFSVSVVDQIIPLYLPISTR